jgi:hypothetical protein
MEPKNNKIINNFISIAEREEIINWINSIFVEQNITNHHIKEVRKNLNGNSYMFDISKNKETEYITNFQSSNNVIKMDLPKIILEIKDRISKTLEIPDTHVFLQVIDMCSGGVVNPHYDASIDGFINYKCNISCLSEPYDFFVDKESMRINEGDLYCFEASLYKHWSNKFFQKRILLSFGFILTYEELARNEYDPRVRLSKRIVKLFQSGK